MITDATLDKTIRLAQQGDRDAQQELIEMHRPAIHANVRRYLRGRKIEEVEDCVQDILLKIVAHIGDFDVDRGVKFSTWIFTFVRNHCFDQLKRKRHPVFSLNQASRDDDSLAGDWIGDGEQPYEIVVRNEFFRSLQVALAELPDELSRIFALREFQGLEFRMIAKRLRLPLGTVKSKHYRALERLQFQLRPYQVAV